MAKILQTKMRLGLNPEKPWEETVVAVCYDATTERTRTYSRKVPDERFYVKLPKGVADALGEVDARGKDQAEAMVRFEEAIARFKKMKTEVNQVILYKFNVEPKPKGDESGYFQGNYEVKVWAGVYEETVAIAGDGNKRYSYLAVASEVNFAGKETWGYCGPRSDRGARWDCQVPYTEQNKVFFLWIKTRMKELIDRLYELQTPDILIETISAGRLFPVGITTPLLESGKKTPASQEGQNEI